MEHAYRDPHVVIVAVWAELVALVVLRHVLPERLLALLAEKSHLHRLRKSMCLCLGMAFRAVIPLLAARSADRNLCVEDVFAVDPTLSIEPLRRKYATQYVVQDSGWRVWTHHMTLVTLYTRSRGWWRYLESQTQ